MHIYRESIMRVSHGEYMIRCWIADRRIPKKASPTGNSDALYIYPEGLTSRKAHRESLRKQLMTLMYNIGQHDKEKRATELTYEIIKFNQFYKNNYRIHSYEIDSVTRKRNRKERDIITLGLNIAKSHAATQRNSVPNSTHQKVQQTLTAIPKNTGIKQIAKQLIKLKHVNAVEVIDSNGTGVVYYYNWP